MVSLSRIIGQTSVIFPRVYVVGSLVIAPIVFAFIFTYHEEIDNYFTSILNQETNIAILLYFIPTAVLSFVIGNNIGEVILSFTKTFYYQTDLSKTVIEYQYSLNIVYIGLPLLIASLVYDQITYGTVILDVDNLSKLETLKFSLNGALGLSLITPIVVGFVTTFFNDFQFYRALGFLHRSKKHSKDNLEKIDNLAYAVKFYNKYLDQRMEYQITNLEQIISKLARMPFIDSFIGELLRAFQREDKLSPFRYLVSFINSPTDANVLTKFHSHEKIIKIAPVLIGTGTLLLLFYNFIIAPIFR